MSALDACGAFEQLAAFDPVLAGTVPLDVDIEGSDLDILCEAREPDVLAEVVTRTYGERASFEIACRSDDGRPMVVARFQVLDFPIEIYGEPSHVEQQLGFRHMLVEHRLLEVGGDLLRERVRRLKRTGVKTEPAFAQLLQLPGDPYEALLALENVLDDELCRIVANSLAS